MGTLLWLQLLIWTASPALTSETPSPSSLPVSCREVVYSRATNPKSLCSCRWDVYRSNYLSNEAACLCPATETTCAKDRKDGMMPNYACLNNAERFYLLEKLLKKRGKKDFAIKIK